MQKGIFSVLDTKSTIFSSPFTSITNATALRDFGGAVLDPNSDLSRYPQDYCLYRIGTFDDLLGTITAGVPESLGFATQFLAGGDKQ